MILILWFNVDFCTVCVLCVFLDIKVKTFATLATFGEIAAHSVYHMFSLYIYQFVIFLFPTLVWLLGLDFEKHQILIIFTFKFTKK